VFPAEGKKDEYLELVQHLKPILETIDGWSSGVGTRRDCNRRTNARCIVCDAISAVS
jgi:hypothetical protein